MDNVNEPTFRQVAFTHFVPGFFLGVISLFLFKDAIPALKLHLLLDNRLDLVDFLAGFANGVFVALAMAAFHLFRNRRAGNAGWRANVHQGPGTLLKRMGVGFLAGSLDILFGLQSEGILALTGMVLLILVGHVRLFIRHTGRVLRPGNSASWRDVAELARIYLTMLAGFTLVNASLEATHLMLGGSVPFGFGHDEGELFLNSLYYTVVSMTTLGFGDIVPVTWDGKLILIFQSLVSYVMFGLMIGIITRGVSGDDAGGV
ncbi:potassium channel family protein [Pseudodesulfovibrio sp.]|uniref:potassium channel family protein n=1 Tax=Pseudodesulfovibrio sp. TaxID=2035812 RepID=UPI00260BDF40|nr:potassium channel family protein [Pseudodesulfovibrio sp.]MDD3312986.1 potassium channel family protein [Pseudodesulfovibrio sp.]